MSQARTSTLDAMITEWHKVATELEHLQLREKQLREELFSRAFTNPTEGTNKVRVGHGMALIGTYRLNYKIDRPLMEEFLKEAHTALIINDVVRFDPKLSDAKYKKLDVDSRNLIAPMVTITPGLPGLEVKAQSKVRW